MDKIFSTTNTQLRKLRKRGMIISNSSCAKRIIEMENYYNLINGYKKLFSSLHTITVIDVQKEMGFPANWQGIQSI